MKMNPEKGVIYLTSMVAIGVVVLSFVATFYHSINLIPVVIMGIILLILILLSNRGNFAHKIESLEKIVFVITFLIICLLFIMRYKPI